MSAEKIEVTLDLANTLIEEGGTLRSLAKRFNIATQTVLNRFNTILSDVDPELYSKVKEILSSNKDERSIRGGQSTKKKKAEAKRRRVGKNVN